MKNFMKKFIKENWVKLILVIAVAIVGYYFGRISNKSTVLSQTYVFAPKAFYDNKVSLYVAGTLTGDDDGYKNSTTAISCSKDRMECLISTIQGISKTSCQLGRLDSPLSLPIVKWDDYVITAIDESPYDTFSCTKTTINIDRKSEVVLWVQEPINQSQLSCKDFQDNKIYKWTIEDPAWMKDFKANLKK